MTNKNEVEAATIATVRALADEWQRIADQELPHDGCFHSCFQKYRDFSTQLLMALEETAA